MEQYSGWSWFLVHLCKMMISTEFCFIFDIFIFRAVRGIKGQKIDQNDKIIFSVELHISGTIHHIRGAYDLD